MVKQLVLLLVLALTSTARAEVGVVVAGEATMQPLLVRQIESWLKSHGHTVAPLALPADAVNTLTDCFVIEDEACARMVIEKRGRTRSIIFARVELQAGGDIDKTVTVTAYWFEAGQKVTSARRFCERCNEASLRTTADDMMGQLIKAAPQSAGRLKLTTDPAGATCAIDGKQIGPTPIEHELAPGEHEITVTSERHRRETRKVAIKSGETTTLDLSLTVESEGGRKSTLGPLVVMSAGAAMIIAGGVMVAMDEDKGPDQPPEINNTAPGGVALAVGGVLAIGGGFLWYRMTKKHESAPVAAVGHDGAYIGWQGRF